MLRSKDPPLLRGAGEGEDNLRATPPGLRFRGLCEVLVGLGAAVPAQGQLWRCGVLVAAGLCHTTLI